MDFSNIKVIGGLGAFFLVFPVPKLNVFFDVIGVILILIAFNEFSNYYRDSELRKYSSLGFILQLLSIIVILVLVGASILTFTLPVVVSGVIAGFIVGYVLFVLGGWWVKKSIDKLNEYNGNLFLKWSGTIIFIGSLLIIAFGIGIFIVWIGYILLAIGFFLMKTPREANGETVFS